MDMTGLMLIYNLGVDTLGVVLDTQRIPALGAAGAVSLPGHVGHLHTARSPAAALEVDLP